MTEQETKMTRVQSRVSALLLAFSILNTTKLAAQACIDSATHLRWGRWIDATDSIHVKLRRISDLPTIARDSLKSSITSLQERIGKGSSPLDAPMVWRLQRNLADLERIVNSSGVWPLPRSADSTTRVPNDAANSLPVASRTATASRSTPLVAAPITSSRAANVYPLLDDIRAELDTQTVALSKLAQSNQSAMLARADSMRTAIINKSQDEFARTQWLQFLQLAVQDLESVKAELRSAVSCSRRISTRDTATIRIAFDTLFVSSIPSSGGGPARVDTVIVVEAPKGKFPTAIAQSKLQFAAVANPPANGRVAIAGLAKLNRNWFGISPMALIGSWARTLDFGAESSIDLGAEVSAGATLRDWTLLPGVILWDRSATSLGGSILFNRWKIGAGVSYFSSDGWGLRLYWRPK